MLLITLIRLRKKRLRTACRAAPKSQAGAAGFSSRHRPQHLLRRRVANQHSKWPERNRGQCGVCLGSVNEWNFGCYPPFDICDRARRLAVYGNRREATAGNGGATGIYDDGHWTQARCCRPSPQPVFGCCMILDSGGYRAARVSKRPAGCEELGTIFRRGPRGLCGALRYVPLRDHASYLPPGSLLNDAAPLGKQQRTRRGQEGDVPEQIEEE